MIAVVQRAAGASVTVGGEIVGRIERGLAVLLAVQATDTPADVEYVANKLAGLRVFPNGDKEYDLDVRQAGGAVLMVSNFTVAAETRKGRRPSFDAAAKPEKGRALFDATVAALRNAGVVVETGVFGADMLVEIRNDGPLTVIVESGSKVAA
jgi:D-tyrosyl-tRNA(Tyr) deacylase